MTWLSTKEVATLLNISDRTARTYAKSRYKYREVRGRGKGGIQIEVALESLPQPVQDKYNGIQEEKPNSYIYLTAKQRENVDYKFNIITKYKEFKETCPEANKLEMFLSRYNEEHPQKPITRRMLLHWQKKFDREGINGLVDKRGQHNKDTSSVPDEVWETFKALYLRDSKPTKEQCYQMVVEQYKDKDIKIPHISSFTRRLEKLGEDALILGREGKKAYADKVLPTALVNHEINHSNFMWIADHHIFDVMVEDEKGKIFRPWLSAWIDDGSRLITGYVINKISPNSDIVLASFADACKKCGIPEWVKLDNGKDYKVYDMFNTDFALSIVNQMGIKVTNALPYNAKAKPIERLFKTLEETYCKMLNSYVGNSPTSRPEKMKKTNKKLSGELMQYKEFTEFVDNMIKVYNNTPHSGNGLNGKPPIERYRENFKKPLRAVKNEDVLNMFLIRTTRALKVGKNGINIRGKYYEADDLVKYFGKKVYARYHSDNINYVYVYSEADEYICVAKCKELVDIGADYKVSVEDIRKQKQQEKAVKEFTKKQMAIGVSALSIEDFVKRKSEKAEEFDIDDVSQVIPIAAQQYKHSKKIKEDIEKMESGDNKTQDNKRTAKDIDKALFELIRQAGG